MVRVVAAKRYGDALPGRKGTPSVLRESAAFDDAVEVPPWQALHAGYVQTSDRFSHEAEKARERGWPVVVLKGTHLHPLLKPQETIDAILEVTRQFADHVIAEDQ